jgi:hypothetical protein
MIRIKKKGCYFATSSFKNNFLIDFPHESDVVDAGFLPLHF